MGWKGTVRSLGAAVRAAERDSKRRQKELERQQKQYNKMQEREQAAYEVDVFDNHIDVIQSIHKECSDRINWSDIAISDQPKEPSRGRVNEQKAQNESNSYKPSIIDRLLNREVKKRALLEQNITNALEADEVHHQERLADWGKSVTEWKESIKIANALLQGDNSAKLESIEMLQPFSEVSNLGSKLSVSVFDNGLVETTIHVHGSKIVPNKAKSLLQNGKLSVKNMPKGRFNEIYQDYVCSCTLRVANELFSVLPDTRVIVTAVDELLNSKTGHLDKTPILSVLVSRSTFDSLNLETIDPSDSMENFVHNMSFKKTKGFDSVERIDTDNLAN